MEGTEILKGVADIAIAFIGFSSIVTALRKGKEQPWSFQERIGLILLALLTFGTVLLAFLPFPLYYLELADWQIYSISAWVFTLYSLAIFLFLIYQNMRHGRTTRVPRVFNLLFGLSLVVLVVMLMLALGRFSQGMLGVYLLGLFWLLGVASVQFLIFIFFVGGATLEPAVPAPAKPRPGSQSQVKGSQDG